MDVVCFGEILWDLFERGPKADGIARDFRRELGGAPANVAIGLSRLGVKTAIVGGVGRDRLGKALVAGLRREGVDGRFVQKLPQRTGITFVLRDARGEPEFLFYRRESADLAIRAAHVTPAMGRARWVLVGTSTSMTRDLAAATTRFVDVAARGGARIFLDLNVRAHLWDSPRAMQRAIASLAGRAALVKASDADLAALGDRKGGLQWLRRHAPGATWLVTRGSRPASAVGVHGAVDVPAIRARCVDATGGGDAFVAGSLAALVSARANPASPAWRDPAFWAGALRIGHMMGAKAVSRPGAVAGLVGLGRAAALLDVLPEELHVKRDPRFKAVAVRSPRGARTTEIDWADGHKGVYPHEILRGYCPCAGCQGHGGPIQFVPNGNDKRELEDISPIGSYALALQWFDGHSGGIYSFEYLRSLCQCDTCRSPERGALPRT